MKPSERKKENMSATTQFVAVTGNTFPVKDQLRAMGGRWNAEKGAWMVPADKAKEAQALVAPAKKTAPVAVSAPSFAGWIAITGDTFKVKGTLQTLGCKFDGTRWMAPNAEVAETAQRITPGKKTVIRMRDGSGQDGWCDKCGSHCFGDCTAANL